jgi:carbonic anhydrase
MTIDAEQAIADLVSGNVRFCKGLSDKQSANSINKLREFAQKSQTPKAIILCCSDSRAPVEKYLIKTLEIYLLFAWQVT